MDNQHKLIKGYRDLSEAEIALMNAVKAKAAEVGELCITLRELHQTMPRGTLVERGEHAEAIRWLDAGELQAQQAFMSLVRSIARPTSF